MQQDANGDHPSQQSEVTVAKTGLQVLQMQWWARLIRCWMGEGNSEVLVRAVMVMAMVVVTVVHRVCAIFTHSYVHARRYG